MGYGPLVRAATGLTEAWRYPGDPESFSDSVTIYPDHVAARVGALAAVALLIRRERTGRGGHASIGQAEVMLTQFGREIASGSDAAPRERSSVHVCAGEDEWCVVTVRNDEDAVAIGRVCGGEAVETWLAGMDANAAMRRLQAAGVPAARMLRVVDLPGFGYFAERRLFRTERHPHLADPFVSEARQAHGGLPDPSDRPAPLMGEQSGAVLRDWLDLKEANLAALVDRGIVQGASCEELAAVAQALAKVADKA
jgi:crotonobetainyl-CoA:carnitine CoA-transferase CaiB-like acyl-CoA transferase